MAFDAARLEAAWKRYVACGTASNNAFRSFLAPPASSAQIATAETAVGCEFPADLRYLLALHNGSDEHMVLPGWFLFSAERIADEWRVWEDIYRRQFKPEGYDCKASGSIRSDEWWRCKWIPFCGDGGGNHLCTDMDPAPGGEAGQIITMWHDDAQRTLIAPSLTEFIELIAADFEQGRLTWDEEWGGVYAPST